MFIRANKHTTGSTTRQERRRQAKVRARLRKRHRRQAWKGMRNGQTSKRIRPTPRAGSYLVMEYIEGEDFGQMIQQVGPLDEARALAWIERVCDALTYLHGQDPPIIHRDIKPSNIKMRLRATSSWSTSALPSIPSELWNRQSRVLQAEHATHLSSCGTVQIVA
jgi:serine/threonine protein kinase